MWAFDWPSSSSLIVSRDMSSKVGFDLSHKVPSTDGPSANMPFRPDFVKVLILRDMELGQTG